MYIFYRVKQKCVLCILCYYNKTKEFVCLIALICGITGRSWKIIFALGSPILEEGYRLFILTIQPLGDEQRSNKTSFLYSV